VLGLGLVQSFGYWCTDFLVVQRALAAEDLAASQRTPLIAAFPKLMYGVLAIFPGLIILSILPNLGEENYNMAVPYAMAYYFPTGMLGVGLTALLAAFMARAFWAWIVCLVVTIAVSLVTQPKPDSELRGIVWGLTEKKEGVEEAWYKKPWVLAVTVLAITVALNIYFW
jgi:uncharacterized sodium:solute symporter family permease YidK